MFLWDKIYVFFPLPMQINEGKAARNLTMSFNGRNSSKRWVIIVGKESKPSEQNRNGYFKRRGYLFWQIRNSILSGQKYFHSSSSLGVELRSSVQKLSHYWDMRLSNFPPISQVSLYEFQDRVATWDSRMFLPTTHP